MQRLTVNLEKRSYDIIVGDKIISTLPSLIKKINSYSKIFIVTDENLAKLHLQKLVSVLEANEMKAQPIILKAGEKTKDFSNLQNLCEKILQNGVDRKSLLIAFGGGVIGDLCGFAASIILRGIDFIQVPTTLLAAVDSSVGGKTAINSAVGKNLIGSFYQPKLVFCDFDYLATLSEREFMAGYGEVVKYGLIKDKSFFDYLDENVAQIKNRNPEILAQIIVRSCKIKAEIVALDEKENDIRALLNFGHTFGHVFETETGYSDELLHGEAVLIGMFMACKMSENLGIFPSDEFKIVKKHFEKMDLISSPLTVRKKWDLENLITHLYKDKKVENKNLTFILLEKIGKAVIKKNISEEDFVKVMKEFLCY